MNEATSLFVTSGEATLATELSRGPWDPSACHGGPVSALLVRACEQIGGHGQRDQEAALWQLARITVELVRPVPVMEPMFVTTEIERPGRNVSLVAARITLGNGTEVAKARALRIRSASVALTESYELEPPFSAPGSGDVTKPIFGDDLVAYHRDGVEMRFATGSWISRGPISLWCRLKVPVMADEQPTGAQRAAATADFSNGVSAEIDPADHIFINPDLSIHLLRPPEGEWIGMQARSHYGPLGAGLAEGALFDERGRCGRSVQSLLLTAR